MNKRTIAVITALLTTILLIMSPVRANGAGVSVQNSNNNSIQAHRENPEFFAMAADLLLARPLLMATTAVGVVIFAVSSPFSAIGGNINQAANALILEPGRATFVRCLGCSYSEGRRF